MAKHFFFKSEKVGSSIKIYPINGQTKSGESIERLAVNCPRSIRSSLPTGSIFYSVDIVKSKTGKYYCVKGFNSIDISTTVKHDIRDEYLKLCGIKLEDVKKETKVLEELMKDPKLKSPESDKDGFYMSSEDWSLLLRNIKKNVNTMIIGPTGTGKTSCVKEACNRLGVKLYIFDMGAMIDPISSLLGVHRLEDGHSIFDFAKFTKVIQEPCVILLDELNRASLSSNNVLFPCLDDRRELNIEIAGSKDTRSIKVHPGVTFIATANIGSEYTGTMGMDKALVNRFFPLELGYIPTEEEEKVLMKRTGISIEQSKLIVKVANNIRSLFNKSEISTSVSVRESLMISNLVADGWDLGEAMKRVYLPLYEGTSNEGERSTVYKTILTY